MKKRGIKKIDEIETERKREKKKNNKRKITSVCLSKQGENRVTKITVFVKRERKKLVKKKLSRISPSDKWRIEEKHLIDPALNEMLNRNRGKGSE